MTNTKISYSTPELFSLAQSALCDRRWSVARDMLEELTQRDDNRDMFCDVSAYNVPEHLINVIGDRIDLVNAKA